MDFRKFTFILCIILSLFLFAFGCVILVYFNISYQDSILDGNFLSNISNLIGDYKSEKKPINFLLLGGDKISGNTDTIMLINFNPSNSKISILSIPRDTYVSVPGSPIPKINSAYPIAGPDTAVKITEDLLDVEIDYYVYMNTTVFRDIIDILGGVDYYIPVDMEYYDPLQDLYINLKAGQQHLNGEQAEQFVRFRQPLYYTNEILKYYDGSDLKRIEAQQNFIKELVAQKANIFYFSKVDDILNIVFNNLNTNMSIGDAVKILANAGGIGPDNMEMFSLPGKAEELNTGWYYLKDDEQTRAIIESNFK